MRLTFRLAILVFLVVPLVGLVVPSMGLSQSYAVNSPFNAMTYKPLDGQERWQRWLREDGGSPSIHLNSFVIASVTQSMNDPPQWGRTTGGFARRLGSNYGRFLIGNSTHESLAGAAGTDPRYFPCACTGLFRRSGHALEMTVLTYSRSGHKTLDIPQLSGAYGGAMIGTFWFPHHYSPLVQGVQVGHLDMALIGTIHMVQEFSPELHRFFHVGEKADRAAQGGDQ